MAEAPEERPMKSRSSAAQEKSAAKTTSKIPHAPESNSPAENALIKKYRRDKSLIRWGLYLLLALVLSYAVAKIISNSATTLFREGGQLGSSIFFRGSVCLVIANNNGRQEVLMSTDSGESFTRTGTSWPLRDSSLIMDYQPGTSTILALEKSGLLRVLKGSVNQYDSVLVPISTIDSVKGMALRPKSDLVYIYSGASDMWSVNIKTLEISDVDLFDDKTNTLESMVFDDEGRAAASVVRDSAKQILVSDNLTQWKDALAVVPSTADSSAIVYSSGTPVFPWSVGFEPNTGTLYAVSYISFRNSGSGLADSFEIVSLNRSAPAIAIESKGFSSKIMLDDQGNAVTYGAGPGLFSSNESDNISFASEILSVSSNRRLALINNPTGNYLVRKIPDTGKWELNPVVISTKRFETIESILPYLILLLVASIIILLIRVFATRKKILQAIKVHNDQNALFPKPEKPLGNEDEDLLGFKALEDAVHHIIQNPQLDMPMTIVISGTWGSGKTSMMNRIKERLEEDPEVNRQFMTTWFNAWHLQGEASLLNSFLLNIINSYERYYTFLSPFRVKIAAARFTRLPFWKKFGFGFSMAIFIPLCLAGLISLLPDSWQPRITFLHDYTATLKKIFMSLPLELTSAIINPVTAGILVIISFLFLNRQFVPTGLSAFFKLIPENNFKLEVEKQESGTREKFRQQYWEIMSAGRKEKRMVIFIDDLDRIGGDKILELLEGINFISDIASRPPGIGSVAPNTIFILGMYTQEVARLVGTQLVKVNGSQVEPLVLGSLYIEKMVQLIVPVPFDTDNDKFKMLYEN